MPAEERVGLDDQHGFLPAVDTGSEEDEPETIGLRKDELLDLAIEDDALLAKQRVFGDEVGLATCEACDGTEHQLISKSNDYITHTVDAMSLQIRLAMATIVRIGGLPSAFGKSVASAT